MQTEQEKNLWFNGVTMVVAHSKEEAMGFDSDHAESWGIWEEPITCGGETKTADEWADRPVGFLARFIRKAD